MNVTISFDEHRVRNTEKIEDIKVLMLKGEKGDAGMTPQDVIDIVDPLLDDYAPVNSPAFTGTPTAPTATAGSDTTQIATTAYVKNEVDSKLSSTYKAKGSVAFASLPSLIAANEGNVYNVTDAFTTTSDFVEGSGKSYPAGTNVVIVNTTGTTYKYDVLSGFVDLSGYLTSSDAANTYLSQSDASSTYLSQSSASSTYATQTALGNTNAKVGSGTLDIGSDLTDGVNQLNSKLTPTEVSTGIDQVVAIKSGNVVQLRINGKTITASSTGWYELVTLPSSLYPKQRVDSAVFDNNASSFSSSHYANLIITNDGKVLVWMFSDKLTLIAIATVTYITN
jgi:hypothetical protein